MSGCPTRTSDIRLRPRATAGHPRYPAAALAVALAAALLQGCTQHVVAPQEFSSPDQAVAALIAAARADDTTRLLAIVGSDGEDIIVSGDEGADRQGRQKFVALYDEKHYLQSQDGDTVTLVVGNADWPFPVPIVKDDKGWSFDAETGKDEILNRRIGANELAVIQVCKAIGDAQREYALRDPEGTGAHPYAQQFRSDPEKRNGLYWPVAEGEPLSPLGELVMQAAGEGYKLRKEGPTPYHGYFYRILKAQGPNAPDGQLDYMVNGKMVLGFAILAYPADYGNSGIVTFTMGPNGVVYQKDLGKDTADAAKSLNTFDPGEGWKKAE